MHPKSIQLFLFWFIEVGSLHSISHQLSTNIYYWPTQCLIIIIHVKSKLKHGSLAYHSTLCCLVLVSQQLNSTFRLLI